MIFTVSQNVPSIKNIYSPSVKNICISRFTRYGDAGHRAPSRGDLLPAGAEPHADGGGRADEVTRDTWHVA